MLEVRLQNWASILSDGLTMKLYDFTLMNGELMFILLLRNLRVLIAVFHILFLCTSHLRLELMAVFRYFAVVVITKEWLCNVQINDIYLIFLLIINQQWVREIEIYFSVVMYPKDWLCNFWNLYFWWLKILLPNKIMCHLQINAR